MPANLILTDAGADLFVEAGQAGTDAVSIDRVVFADGRYQHTADQTALRGNTLRTLTTADGSLTAGGSIAGNVIHLSVQDTDATQAYEVYEAGVFSGSTLVAVWSAGASGDPLLVKTTSTSVWLVIDIAIASGAASVVEVGDLSLDINQSTTEKRGTAELATAAEAAEGTDPWRIITPATLKGETDKLVTLGTEQQIAGGKTFAQAPKTPTLADLTDSSTKIPNTEWVQLLFKKLMLAAHPVGSYYITEGSENPGTLFGGTWTKVQNAFLYGSGTLAAGAAGGAASVTLTVDNLPAHTHTATAASGGGHTHTGTTASGGGHTHTGTTASGGGHTHVVTVVVPKTECSCVNAGKHNHSVTAASNGAHTHGRGTMNIEGSFTADDMVGTSNDRGVPKPSGAFYSTDYSSNKYDAESDTSKHGVKMVFDASRNWTGSTSSNGAHSHTLTCDNEAAHSHTVTLPKITIENGSAASNGAHTHTLATATGGAHTHTLTTATGGAHSHTITVGSSGNGDAFSILPPFRAVNMWKRTA